MGVSDSVKRKLVAFQERKEFKEAAKFLEASLLECKANDDKAQIAQQLAHLYRFDLKDRSNKAADYALMAGRFLLADGRMAPAVAVLKWLTECPEARVHFGKLETLIHKATVDLEKVARELSNSVKDLRTEDIVNEPSQATNRVQHYPLFVNLSLDDTKKLMKLATIRELEPGEILFREGDEPLAFYIVADGKMELKSTQGLKKTLKEGDFFGELALFGKTKRSATLRSAEGAKLLVFSETALRETFKRWPAFPKRIFQFFNLRLFMNATSRSIFFKGFTEEELEECFRFFTPQLIDREKIIMLEGQLSDSLYLIVRGQVQVSRDKKLICRLGAGHFIGEIGVLRKRPRNANVMAITNSVLLECSRTNFERLVDRFPKLLRALKEIANLRAPDFGGIID